MTDKSKLPLETNDRIISIKESFHTFFRKVEVITDSAAIVNTVRLLIVLLALLMGYIHTSQEKSDISSTNKEEIYQQSPPLSPILIK